MKKLLIFLSVFIPLIVCSKDEGRFSEMLIMARNIEIGLHEQFLVDKKPLPSSLNEIEFLNEIATRNPAMGMLFNEMSVVPDVPAIIEAPDISRDHFNWRIFAIGRTVNTDHQSYKGADGKDMPGRYSVWISPDGTYYSPGWIPEMEVQAVFKQIGGFDPSGQPVAFPEAAKMVREKKQRDKIIKQEMREAYERQMKRSAKNPASESISESHTTHLAWWLFAGLGLLALFFWAVFTWLKKK